MASYLVTGVSGEIGHSLINFLADEGGHEVVACDLQPLEAELLSKCTFFQESILDENLIQELTNQYQFDVIFHLAGVLSSGGEKNPQLAHDVNVNGSLKLMQLARAHSKKSGSRTIFMFPSTIAVHGIPSHAEKQAAGCISEDQFLQSDTMYGVNKRYIEELGRYFEFHYGMLDQEEEVPSVDFRCIRFPGIISAETLPTGGTSDYGPEMLHAAGKGEAYECFVREDSQLPFVVMPDAVKALIQLSRAKGEGLQQKVYSITSFAPTAGEIRREIKKYYPSAHIAFKPDVVRQKIVDSWPGNVNDDPARRDWGWVPQYDLKSAFQDYLVPSISNQYKSSQLQNVVGM